MTDPLSRTYEVESDVAEGRVLAVIDAAGERTEYDYDTDGQLIRVTHPEGDKVEYAYDARANVTEVRRIAKPGSGLADLVQTASYPASCVNPVTCNKPTSTTNIAGETTDYTYDAGHGGLLTITEPAPGAGADRPQTRLSYVSLPAWYKDASGSIVSSGDPIDLPQFVRTCLSGEAPACENTADEQEIEMAYGPTGVGNNRQVERMWERAGDGSLEARTIFDYDHNGDLISVDGQIPGTADTTVFFYDDARQPIGAAGPDPDGAGPLNHRASRTTYDEDGRVIRSESGTVSAQTEAGFAAFTPLEKVEVEYDAAGRPVEQRLMAGSTIHALQQISYNAAGQRDCSAKRMNPSAFSSPPASACTAGTAGAFGPDRITRTEYGTDGRVSGIVEAYGTTVEERVIEYAYTANGRIDHVTTARGAETDFSYDGFDRQTRIDYPDPATPGAHSGTDYEAYTYDADGRMATRRVRSGQVFDYTYDDLGRVSLVNAPGTQPDTSFTYDNLGNLVSITEDGDTITNAWDARGRLTSQTGPHGAVSYQYDAASRRTRMTWPDGFYVGYDHDVSGALTHIRENGAASGVGVLARFEYDDRGRRTALIRGNGTRTDYAYDAVSRMTRLDLDLAGSADDASWSLDHNPAGQITSRTLSNDDHVLDKQNLDLFGDYNLLDQIDTVMGAVTFDYDDRGNLIDNGSGSFTYDLYNRLVSADRGAGAVTLGYDPLGRLDEIGGAAPARGFQYDGWDRIAQYDGTGALQHRWVHGPATDEPLVRYDGSGTSARTFLHADIRGSIVAHSDSAGARTAALQYDEAGIRNVANPGHFQYTGQIWIGELELYYYKNRFLDPQLYQFISADPIGLAGGLNLYAYAGNDPVNASDPYGLRASRLKGRHGGAGFWDLGGYEQCESETRCTTTARFIRYPGGSIQLGSLGLFDISRTLGAERYKAISAALWKSSAATPSGGDKSGNDPVVRVPFAFNEALLPYGVGYVLLPPDRHLKLRDNHIVGSIVNKSQFEAHLLEYGAYAASAAFIGSVLEKAQPEDIVAQGSRLRIDVDFGSTIGRTRYEGLPTSNVRVVLEEQANLPGGATHFVVTAYPIGE